LNLFANIYVFFPRFRLRCRVAFTRGQSLLTSLAYSNMKIIVLDLSTPTTVNPKTTLVKGDLFAISLNENGKQKLVMQVDRVDEERLIQSQQLGRN